MDTKDKNRTNPGGRARKNPAPGSQRPQERPRQPKQGREDPRRTQQPRQYQRSAPHGANVYGAGGTASRTRKPQMPVKEEPKKETVFQVMARKGAQASEAAAASRQRVMKAQRQMAAKRKKKRARQKDTPAVIYTDPKPFNRSRLVVQLMTVAAVVIALVLGLSVFFKVKVIEVSGAKVYSNWAVAQASGIRVQDPETDQAGDNLLTFSRTRASAQIRAALPYVEEVRIGIKLPDTVNIYIKELEVTYAVQDQDGVWWLMTSQGRIVEQTDDATAEKFTQILGVSLDHPVVNEQAIALEQAPTETMEDGETIPVTVTGAQRLSAALQILTALEANDIVGEAASVDVTSVNSIELWYGTRYQVQLGDTSRMEYKIACMNDVILEFEDYQKGILDVSFTTWADQVGFTPFS